MPCKNPCRLYVHLAFTYSIGPSSVVWSELGPAPPFPPMSVWSVMVTGSQFHVWSGLRSRHIFCPKSFLIHWKLYLVSSILFVFCSILIVNRPYSVTNTKYKSHIIWSFLVNYLGHHGFTMLWLLSQLLSGFSSKIQQLMTMLHYVKHISNFVPTIINIWMN